MIYLLLFCLISTAYSTAVKIVYLLNGNFLENRIKRLQETKVKWDKNPPMHTVCGGILLILFFIIDLCLISYVWNNF